MLSESNARTTIAAFPPRILFLYFLRQIVDATPSFVLCFFSEAVGCCNLTFGFTDLRYFPSNNCFLKYIHTLMNLAKVPITNNHTHTIINSMEA